MGLIILGSIKLVVETYVEVDTLEYTAQTIFIWIDNFFTITFSIECIMKIIKYGFYVAPDSYLKDSWSILDFIIVTTSILDWAVSSINLPILKLLRLLRTLRPLRFISKNQNMRIVVNSLFESIVAMLNVLLVIGMVWVMFAILGNNLMGGKMATCVNVDPTAHPNFDFYGVSKQSCIDNYQGTWKNAWWNFDDIGQSMVTLYVLSNMEGWPAILNNAMDANDPNEGPRFNNSDTNAIFLMIYILFGRIFLYSIVLHDEHANGSDVRAVHTGTEKGEG